MSQDISSGILSVFGDGKVFNVLAEAKYDLSLVEIEVIRGINGHYSERHKPVPPMIAVKISDQGSLATSALTGARFDVVQMNLLNGKTVKLNKAIIVSRTEVDADAGELNIIYMGTADPDEETTG